MLGGIGFGGKGLLEIRHAPGFGEPAHEHGIAIALSAAQPEMAMRNSKRNPGTATQLRQRHRVKTAAHGYEQALFLREQALSAGILKKSG
ncbi:hypothetical protein GCM10023184_23540 [Flaviaesturariibacter amylovorans]|uniref:Uncharacterized protein n=1 Tax=Flaviaesturariibacter amylovorans TaxID=1084520 RepID=A0ABP8GXV1_9BACT